MTPCRPPLILVLAPAFALPMVSVSGSPETALVAPEATSYWASASDTSMRAPAFGPKEWRVSSTNLAASGAACEVGEETVERDRSGRGDNCLEQQ